MASPLSSALKLVPKNLLVNKNPSVTLYRHITKHVPRVLTLYDINMDPSEARLAIQALFRENEAVKDPRVIDMLISKANMELEETLMQWKQKVHLETLLERGQNILDNQNKGTDLKRQQKMEDFFACINNSDDDDDDDDEDFFYEDNQR